MKPLSILVADDEENIRLLIEHWLKSMGHEVCTAENGVEALKIIRAGPVDLLITDILMPEVDGLSVIAGLRTAQPGARILAISGGGRYMDSHEYLRIAQGFGADSVVIKPFGREQFLAGMGRAMARRESLQA